MNMHTPGPWYLVRNGAGNIVCAEAATLLDINSGAWCLDIVARTDWGRGREDEANARLIAAAPDLLMALQALVERYINVVDAPSGAQGGWDANTEEEIIAARVAIAKAVVDAAARPVGS